MKRIQSKAGLLKKRVNAIHSRAQFVGIMYVLATFALAAVVAIVPMLNNTAMYAKNTVMVVAYYNSLKALFEMEMETLMQPDALIVLIQFAVYFVLLLTLVVNALRTLGKLNWLFKRRASYVNGFNRNMYAMDAIGKRFSGSFAAVVICYLLFAVLAPRGENLELPTFTLAGYITLGMAVLVRFVFGAMEGNVTLFTNGNKIVEKKRDHSVISYFIRNLMQIAVLGGMFYFLNIGTAFGAGFENILTQILVEGDMMYIINVNTLPVYLELLGLICLMVMIKHATASTEYNRECNQTSGKYNFTIFALIAAVAFGAIIVFPFVGIGLPEGVEATLNMPILWTAVIALSGFILDCCCRVRDKQRIEEETDEDPVPMDEELAVKPNVPYGMPAYPQMAYPYAPQGQMPYQPVFVPVFYGYPQGMMAQSMFAPTPAPEHLLPAPSPKTAADEEKETKNEKVQDEAEMLNPYRKYKVYCPQCGSGLMVKDGTPYHRCPACDKVFTLRKFKTYVKSE